MEEVYNFAKYFPISIADTTLEEYFEHHLNALLKCCENQLFSSAYFHLHVLYMVFIYVHLFRIAKSKERESDFNQYIQDFKTKTNSKDLKIKIEHPFMFAVANEKAIFDFFYILWFEYKRIKEISELVNIRNEQLHANGELFFKKQEDFEIIFDKYIEKMIMIIAKQKIFLWAIYDDLVQNYELWFEMTQDEIETNFAAQYFFSENELKLLAQDKNDIVSKFIAENF